MPNESKLPGPKSALAAYARLYRDPLGYLVAANKKYGDIVHMQLGKRHDFLLNHPDYIRAVLLDTENFRRSVHRPLQRVLGQGLLTAKEPKHKRQRTMLQPIFHRQKIAALGGMMVEEIARWSDRWRDGATVDMGDEMTNLAMSIAGKTLFNVDFDTKAPELRSVLTTILKATRFNNLLVASKHLEKLPLPVHRRFARDAKQLDDMIREMIDERRAGPCDDPDLLSVLVSMHKQSKRGLTDQKIRDQILTFFIGGHETIASGLMWTWYLLAKNGDSATKLRAEVDAVLGQRLPTVEDIERLPYTRMVFSESMRLYPPVWIMGRRALAEVKLNGCTIPSGSYVHVSQYLMHRDARFFPEPERFDPERWTQEAAAARPKFSYFPFGGGGMQCIGEGFAWMQAVFAISILARRWEMKVQPGLRVELQGQITLRSRHGMPMILKKRKIA
ncbi:MAG: cytochrome P450 [Verrucomicrobiota bacterium]|nr:cytochrome P450 [Verrucomicrobiota bacterium]